MLHQIALAKYSYFTLLHQVYFTAALHEFNFA